MGRGPGLEHAGIRVFVRYLNKAISNKLDNRSEEDLKIICI